MTNNKLTGLGVGHPANGPLTTERLTHVRDVLQRKLKYSNGGNMDYIIADAVKAIDDCDGCCPKCNSPIDLNEEPYTAPPAPVDNDDLHEAVSDLLAALDEYPEQLVPINRKSFLVRTIRAAMLQGDKS
ncbi:hypothetical protein [Citrobacter koseri]|uniref:hypothetical protein n=1 Tax=Citrobacter koseri TaxID=545 RepID=UPI001F38D681|nr:hypothetical protein [Citrobacter koseri]